LSSRRENVEDGLYCFWTYLFGRVRGQDPASYTFAYAASSRQRFAVFIGASLALMVTSFIGAYLGGMLGRFIPYQYVHKGAGLLFIGIGIFMIL